MTSPSSHAAPRCGRCGAILAPGARFCAQCGTPAWAPPSPPGPPAAPRQKSIALPATLLIVLLTLLGAGGGAGYAYATKPPARQVGQVKPDAPPPSLFAGKPPNVRATRAGAFEIKDVAVFDPRLLKDLKCAGCMPSPRFNYPARGAPPASSLFAYATDDSGWQGRVDLTMQPDRALRAAAVPDTLEAFARAASLGSLGANLPIEVSRNRLLLVSGEAGKPCRFDTTFVHRTFVIMLSYSDNACPRPPREIVADWTSKAKALADKRFPPK